MRFFYFLLFVAFPAFSSVNFISDYAKSSGKYLIVSKTIQVLISDTLLILPGLNILFKPFTGISVDGVLISRGTQESPVCLTSLNDTASKANPFDWDGLYFKAGSTCSLSYTFLGFSTSGITSDSGSVLLINDCIFSKNGQWHIKYSGTPLEVSDNTPFSYPVKPVLSISDSSLLPKKAYGISLKQKRILMSIVSVGFITASVVSFLKSNSLYDEYYAYKPGHPAYDSATPSKRVSHYKALKGRSHKFSYFGWGFSVAGVLSGGYVCLTYFF